ncbi:MAG TPA: peptide deformylase [Thermomicrobiales bacterium]|nr:peptide deformylase [Thermomicrobiales bacterium]
MALLHIITEGDPRLRQKAIKIRHAEESLKALAADMHETMDAAPGVGLAGPQVGVMRRIIVVHVPEGYLDDSSPDVRMTLLNPEIVKGHGEEIGTEGCLSIPGWVGEVRRMTNITVKAMDLDDRSVRIKAEGWFARILQHEIDHLDGILFVDRMDAGTKLEPETEDDDLPE